MVNEVVVANPVQLVAEQKQDFIKYAKWGVVLAACALALPVIVYGALGLVGLGIAGAIGIIGINAKDVLAEKMANWKYEALEKAANDHYRAMEAEKLGHLKKVQQQAAENPIETAVTQSQAFKDRGVQQLNAITAYGTEVNNFQTMTEGFAKKYPEQATRYKQQLDVMKKALQFKQDKYSELQRNIKLMDEQIEFLRANWKMSQALQKANALAGVDTEDPMAQLKTDAAIDAVVNSINRAFAEMDSSVLQDTATAGKGTITQRAELINVTPGMQMIANDESPTLQITQVDSMATILARQQASAK
jgi:hypothetical protein